MFDKYGVDLVLQGHDHTYGRSGLMREDNLLSGEQLRTARGTVYAVSISGAKMYALDKLAWATRSAANLQLYQLVRVDGDVLKYEARTARGDLYDAFELRKRPNGGNDLTDTVVPPPASPAAPDWPESAPLPRRPSPEPPATVTAPREEQGDYGHGVAAAVILGSVVLGVVGAIRGAGQKPRA